MSFTVDNTNRFNALSTYTYLLLSVIASGFIEIKSKSVFSANWEVAFDHSSVWGVIMVLLKRVYELALQFIALCFSCVFVEIFPLLSPSTKLQFL